jgi:hypothetical protein
LPLSASFSTPPLSVCAAVLTVVPGAAAAAESDGAFKDFASEMLAALAAAVSAGDDVKLGELVEAIPNKFHAVLCVVHHVGNGDALCWYTGAGAEIETKEVFYSCDTIYFMNGPFKQPTDGNIKMKAKVPLTCVPSVFNQLKVVYKKHGDGKVPVYQFWDERSLREWSVAAHKIDDVSSFVAPLRFMSAH